MKFFLAILLIVGTSVGAGMLGLPVETAASGFFPAACLFFLCWGVMILSGCVFAEVLVKYKSGSNFITLTQEILGTKMTKVVFIFYVMLFFSLITAYTKGIGLLIGEQFLLNSNFTSIFFIISMLPLIYFGANAVG